MHLTELFIVGLGYDLSGAVLLAWGLLASPEDMVKGDMTWWGVSGSIGRSIKDKVLGGIGVCYLVLGFLLQAVAYVLAMADGTSVTRGDSAEVSSQVTSQPRLSARVRSLTGHQGLRITTRRCRGELASSSAESLREQARRGAESGLRAQIVKEVFQLRVIDLGLGCVGG